ncbi:MAG: hypothetical protein L6R41_001601 [Letrouitia leprolyta]|nr:MAG: hypothetical protein L6R41_001601 [Letrouitia leprolyta]
MFISIGYLVAITVPILWLGKLVYNVYLHPLSKYPGPKAAAATKVPLALKTWQGVMARWVLALHEEHNSDVVRISPDELSFIAPDAWTDICGVRQRFRKNSVLTPGLDSIVNANETDHPRLRKVMSYAFSEKAIKEQEYLIQSHVDELVDRMRKEASPRILDLEEWINWTYFDIVGDLAFGEPFGTLQGSTARGWASKTKIATRGYTQLCVFGRFPPVGSIIQALMWKKLRGARDQHDAAAAEKTNRRLDSEKHRPDFVGHILAHNDIKGGMSRQEIISNASTLILAGADTMVTTTTGTLSLLIQNPPAMQRVQDEIHSAFTEAKDIQFHNLDRLEYLPAVIQEALRMYPPATNGQARITPREGAVVCGHALPGGTCVQINQYAANMCTRNFSSPTTFAPTRWMGDEKFSDDKLDAVQPFSFGPRNCIGKTLALFQVRLVLCKLFWNFDIEAVGETDKDWRNQKSWATWHRKPLILGVRERKMDR